jgi:hypothetical protein
MGFKTNPNFVVGVRAVCIDVTRRLGSLLLRGGGEPTHREGDDSATGPQHRDIAKHLYRSLCYKTVACGIRGKGTQCESDKGIFRKDFHGHAIKSSKYMYIVKRGLK